VAVERNIKIATVRTPSSIHGPISFELRGTGDPQECRMGKKIDEQWEDLQILPLSEKYVTYTGRIRSTVTDSTGHTSTTRLLETGVLAKREDRWKLLCGLTGKLPD
jgi:hypothetical protein